MIFFFNYNGNLKIVKMIKINKKVLFKNELFKFACYRNTLELGKYVKCHENVINIRFLVLYSL